MLRNTAHVTINATPFHACAMGVALVAGLPAAAQAAQGTGKEPVPLSATSITGEAGQQAYQTESASSHKHTAPLRDTPRSVTVIPQQVMNDTGALTLQDALRTVPGITFGAGEGGNPQGDRPFIRGFDAQGDIYVDGVRDAGAQSREIFAIESVEVSKGPNSAFGGRGSAGGSLNLVTKQPRADDFTTAAFTYGSDQTRRYTLDLNRQFMDTAAFRLNVMNHEQNVAGRDAINMDRWGVAPSLTFGLGSADRLNLSYYHMQSDDLPDSGMPYGFKSPGGAGHTHDKPVDGGDSSNFYGLKDRDFRKTRADIGTISFEHDFSETMTLRNVLRHGNSGQDYILTQPDGSQRNVDRYGTLWRRANSRVSTTDTTTLQTDLLGEFRALGFNNTYATGVELSREKTRVSRYSISPNSNPGPTSPGGAGCQPGESASGTCTSLARPNPNDLFTGTVKRDYAGTTTHANTRSAYVFNTVELDPQWLLNLGVRYDSFQTTADSAAAHLEHDSQFWNWQAGLTYKPARTVSLYVSFATAATPPGGVVGEGQEENPLSAGAAVSDLDPETTRNYEIGTKWEVFDERLSLTAAVFRTEKHNTRVLVSEGTYENAGNSRVDGMELSASGMLTDNWQVFAGYSLLKSELVKAGLNGRNGVVAGTPSHSGNTMPNTPKNTLSLWSTYAATPRVTVGGGAFYVDKVWGDTGNTVYVPAYTRYDAMASYKLNKHVDVQLNVQNLTDKNYYDKAHRSHSAVQGAGRTALLTTTLRY